MDKTIRRVTDVDQQDAENYRYWQSLTLGERLGAVSEMSRDAYALSQTPIFQLYRDHADLLSELNAHGARYMLVGGYAVSAYSQPRATKDLDGQFEVPVIAPEDLIINNWPPDGRRMQSML